LVIAEIHLLPPISVIPQSLSTAAGSELLQDGKYETHPILHVSHEGFLFPLEMNIFSSLIGHRFTREILWTGRTLTGQCSSRIGLFSCCLPAQALHQYLGASDACADIAGCSHALSPLSLSMNIFSLTCSASLSVLSRNTFLFVFPFSLIDVSFIIH
jgi:hypothetical protein